MSTSRRVFIVDLGRSMAHNNILIIPRVNLSLIGVHTISSESEFIQIASGQMEMDSDTSIRYATVFSRKIWIEVEAPYASELSMGDLLSLEVSLSKYNTFGEYRSEEGRVSFHRYVSPVWQVENVKDALIDATIGIRTMDRYGNIVYDDTVPVSLNEDGIMVTYATSGSSVKLPIRPLEGSVTVVIDGSYTEEFTIDQNIINIDIPNETPCYIKYKPFFMESGAFEKVTDNISINSNGEMRLRNDSCDVILFTYTIKMYNTDITSTNHTPIIKSLGIVSSNK